MNLKQRIQPAFDTERHASRVCCVIAEIDLITLAKKTSVLVQRSDRQSILGTQFLLNRLENLREGLRVRSRIEERVGGGLPVALDVEVSNKVIDFVATVIDELVNGPGIGKADEADPQPMAQWTRTERPRITAPMCGSTVAVV